MPRVSTELAAQFWEPVAQGPMAQADISGWSALGGPPTTIAASGSWNSNLIPTDGFRSLAVGVTSSQAGVLTVQRYLDPLGVVAQGPAITAAMSAAVPAVINATDGAPCQSFKITISNSGGSTANITNFACLLNAT